MEKRKVDLAAKLLSSHDYLNEVPVEGEESGRFNSHMLTIIATAHRLSEKEAASTFLLQNLSLRKGPYRPLWQILSDILPPVDALYFVS
jgi:hypothetical protein